MYVVPCSPDRPKAAPVIHFPEPAWYSYLFLLLAPWLVYWSYRKGPENRELSNFQRYALLALRSGSILILLLLMFRPHWKQQAAERKEPRILWAIDQSKSMLDQGLDATELNDRIQRLQEGFRDVASIEMGFSSKVQSLQEPLRFDGDQTDLHALLSACRNQYGNDPTVQEMVLLSDGQVNRGADPLSGLLDFPFPVHTICIGSPPEGPDAQFTNIRYNPTAESGNQLEVIGRISATASFSESVALELLDENGAILERREWAPEELRSGVGFSLYPQVGRKLGQRKWQLRLIAGPEEVNKENNTSPISFEVVKKDHLVALIYDRMHPDVRAIAQSLEEYEAYELEYVDMARNELPSAESGIWVVVHPGRTAIASLRRLLPDRKVPVWYLAGYAESARALAPLGSPLRFQPEGGSDDQVMAALDASFSAFRQSEDNEKKLGKGVPLAAPFGKWIGTKQMDVQLRQRINGVISENPLMSSGRGADGRKWVITSAKGLWRWRFQEYRTFEQTEAFDDWVGSWLRYLKSESGDERWNVDALKEVISGASWKAEVRLRDRTGAWSSNARVQAMVTGPDGAQKSLKARTRGHVQYIEQHMEKEGSYSYALTAELGKETFSYRGRFQVSRPEVEQLTNGADTALLGSLSRSTGGKAYALSDLTPDLLRSQMELRPVMEWIEEEKELIHWKSLFFVLLLFLATEWTWRRYLGLS